MAALPSKTVRRTATAATVGAPRGAACVLSRTAPGCIATFLACAGAAFGQPVLITAPTTIGPQATTITPTGGGAAVPLATAQITVRATTLTINGRHAVASLGLESSALLTHSPNTSFDYSGVGTDIVKGMALTVSGDASIPALSRIDVSNSGYPGGTGPGLGTLGGGSCGAGGSGHGGPGGHGNCPERPGGLTYGSATQPTDFGSGGGYYPGFGIGGAGGGCVRLIVGGSLTLTGSVLADGGVDTNSAGGAGGSIWITAREVLGSGLLQANGGAQGTSNGSGGGGGGGRIAVTGMCTLSSTITTSVQGGAAPPGQTGGVGTVHTSLLTPPSIQSDPQSAVTCPTVAAPFSVSASGDAITYTWQIQTAPGVWLSLTAGPSALPCGGTAFATAPAAASTGIGISPCPSIAQYQVRCLVSNVCSGVTSNEATCTVRAVPSIQASPQNAVACPADTASFSVAATGDSLSYAWQIQTAPGIWTNLVTSPAALPCGGTAFAATPSAASTQIGIVPCAGISQYQLRCIVSNTCESVTSNEATYNVRSLPAIQAGPQNATACSSATPLFSVSATGDSPSYDWQIQTAPAIWVNLTTNPAPLPCGGTAFAATPHAASTTIGIAPCAGINQYQVRCLVSDTCSSAASNQATYTFCYANCDCSTATPILNVNDFQCFLNLYAASNPLANCDSSTVPPTLNVNDFQCFLNKYAVGCP